MNTFNVEVVRNKTGEIVTIKKCYDITNLFETEHVIRIMRWVEQTIKAERNYFPVKDYTITIKSEITNNMRGKD